VGLQSEIPDIIAALNDLMGCFDLELPRAGGTLGEKLLDLAAEGVIDCFLTETDPDGNPWPPLSPTYEQEKQKLVGSQPIGYLYGLLADPAEIVGRRTITADTASMEYGVTQAARDEADWFETGDPSRNRPPRPFYGITRTAETRIGRFLDDHFDKVMK
jgi:hypothetical protein